MPYIGQSPTQVAFVTDTFSGNGTTVAFTMSVAPANTASVLVAVSGVLQTPNTYSVSGTTLTFSSAPPTGTGNISCRYLGIPASGVTTTAYRTVTEFTATAGQTTFTPPSYTVGFINVYRNGVLLGSADYTATNGTTVVLATGATAGDLVTVESFLVSSVLNAIPATTGSVGSTYLADASVTTAKIADANVTQAKLGTNVAGTGPAFRAYLTGTQTVGNSSFTKITLNAETFDTASAFDATTNYRFQPLVAGYYQINGQVSFSGASIGYSQISIYKNGSGNTAGSGIINNTQIGGQCMVSDVIYLNGSTDYVELFAWQNSGGNLTTLGLTGGNFMSGAMVRAA